MNNPLGIGVIVQMPIVGVGNMMQNNFGGVKSLFRGGIRRGMFGVVMGCGRGDCPSKARSRRQQPQAQNGQAQGKAANYKTMMHGVWCNKGPLGMIQGRFDPISMRAQDRDQGPIYKSQIKENQGNKNKGIGFGFQNPQPSCHQDGH